MHGETLTAADADPSAIRSRSVRLGWQWGSGRGERLDDGEPDAEARFSDPGSSMWPTALPSEF